jgi:hypothetical protein
MCRSSLVLNNGMLSMRRTAASFVRKSTGDSLNSSQSQNDSSPSTSRSRVRFVSVALFPLFRVFLCSLMCDPQIQIRTF